MCSAIGDYLRHIMMLIAWNIDVWSESCEIILSDLWNGSDYHSSFVFWKGRWSFRQYEAVIWSKVSWTKKYTRWALFVYPHLYIYISHARIIHLIHYSQNECLCKMRFFSTKALCCLRNQNRVLKDIITFETKDYFLRCDCKEHRNLIFSFYLQFRK